MRYLMLRSQDSDMNQCRLQHENEATILIGVANWNLLSLSKR